MYTPVEPPLHSGSTTHPAHTASLHAASQNTTSSLTFNVQPYFEVGIVAGSAESTGVGSNPTPPRTWVTLGALFNNTDHFFIC